MRYSTRAILLGFLVLVPLGCASGGSTAEPAAPTARDVLAVHVERTGTDRLVAETSSMHARGRIELPAMGIRGTIEVFQAKPSSYLVRTVLGPAGENTVGYDGETGWTSNSMLGTHVLAGRDLYQLQVEADYRTGLMSPEDYASVELLGNEEFEGRDCTKVVTVRRAPDDPTLAQETLALRTRTHWFDAETGLQAGLRQLQSSPMGDAEATLVFEDYEPIGGYLQPRRVRQISMGMEVVITVDEVDLDTVEPKVFELPEAVRNQLPG